MGDIEHLRLGFCSLIMQAKGSLISNFVAWLDLKVAEYKVYGHMILTDDNENEGTGAWQYTSPSDPSNWPRNLPDSYGDQASSGPPPQMSRSSIMNFRGRKAPYARPRPARPKSVTNLLKNAISRAKNTSSSAQLTLPSSQPIAANSTSINTTTDLSHTVTSLDSYVQSSTALETVTTASTSGPESSSTLVKSEPGLEMTVEAAKSEHDPAMNEQGMWLSDPASATLMDQMPGTSFSTPPPPRAPRGRGRGRGGSMSAPRMSTGAASSAMVANPAAKRTPSRDSVNELLQTHTIQTESGFGCTHCNKSFTRLSSLDRHMKECHLGIRHECPACEKSYARRDMLHAHVKSAHQRITSYF